MRPKGGDYGTWRISALVEIQATLFPRKQPHCKVEITCLRWAKFAEAPSALDFDFVHSTNFFNKVFRTFLTGFLTGGPFLTGLSQSQQ